jgi:hypothetical protein
MEKTDEEARGLDSVSGALVSSTLGSVFSVVLILAISLWMVERVFRIDEEYASLENEREI